MVFDIPLGSKVSVFSECLGAIVANNDITLPYDLAINNMVNPILAIGVSNINTPAALAYVTANYVEAACGAGEFRIMDSNTIRLGDNITANSTIYICAVMMGDQ